MPLLPLWAVRPVQSLGAYTRVHFTLPSTPPLGFRGLLWGEIYLYCFLRIETGSDILRIEYIFIVFCEEKPM